MSEAAAVPRPPRAVTAVSAWLAAVGGTSVVGAMLYAAGWAILDQRAKLLGLPLVTAESAEILAVGFWEPLRAILWPLYALIAPGFVPVAWLALVICLGWLKWRAQGAQRASRCDLRVRTILAAALALSSIWLLNKITAPLLATEGLLLQGETLTSVCQAPRKGLRLATGGTTTLGVVLQVGPGSAPRAVNLGPPPPVSRLLATCILLLLAAGLWGGEFFRCLSGWRRRGGGGPYVCRVAGLYALVVLVGAAHDYLGLLGVVARPFEHKTCLVEVTAEEGKSQVAVQGKSPALVEHVYLGDAGPYHFFVDCRTGELVSYDKAPRKIIWRASAHVLSVAMQARQRSLPTTQIPPAL